MNTIESVKYEESSISYYGWTVTGMSFLANVIGYGIVLAFGVFLKPLAAEFGWSRSLITGAFTLYAVLHNFLAIFTGQLADRFGPRILILIGGLCIGSGTLLMMFIGSIWQVYLFYGILLSIGVSCLYAPLLSNVSKWFHKKRGLAIGITAGGVGAASLVFSPLSAALITAYGWRTAYMSLGITCWLVFIPVVLLMRSPQPIRIGDRSTASTQPSGLSFKEASRTVTFRAFCLVLLFGSFAEWAMLIHIVPLATDRGFTLVDASMIAAVISICSFAGKVGGGWLSDRLGRKNVWTAALLFQTLTVIMLYFSQQVWVLFLFAVLFGLSMGGWTGIIGAFPADYFGMRSTGAILGFALVVGSIGISTGPLVGSYFYDTMNSYNNMILTCIFTSLVAVFLSLLMKPVYK